MHNHREKEMRHLDPLCLPVDCEGEFGVCVDALVETRIFGKVGSTPDSKMPLRGGSRVGTLLKRVFLG